MSADIDFDGPFSSPLLSCPLSLSFCGCCSPLSVLATLSYPPSSLPSAGGPKLAWSYLRFHPVKRVFLALLPVRISGSWFLGVQRHSHM